MMVYSEHYRYQDLTKSDMRKIWKRFLEQYDRVFTLHSFSRISVKPEKDPRSQITCTGALLYEHGVGRIVGQGRNAPNRPEFG